MSGTGRDPRRSLAAIGAAALTLEAVVVLLAVPLVISLSRDDVNGAGLAYVAALPLLLIVAAAGQRRGWGVAAGTVAQPLVVIGGLVTWALYVLGAVFGAIWVGYLVLRRQSL